MLILWMNIFASHRKIVRKFFVIENVPQFITCESGKFLSKVLTKIEPSVYNHIQHCNETAMIGGYTTEKGPIIIGSRIGKIQLPQLKLYPFHTVREALSKSHIQMV